MAATPISSHQRPREAAASPRVVLTRPDGCGRHRSAVLDQPLEFGRDGHRLERADVRTPGVADRQASDQMADRDQCNAHQLASHFAPVARCSSRPEASASAPAGAGRSRVAPAHAPARGRQTRSLRRQRPCAGAPGTSRPRRLRCAVILSSTLLALPLLQQPQSVQHHQQACAHVGKHRHPHRGVAEHRQHQEHRLDAQRQRDVLPQHRMCRA